MQNPSSQAAPRTISGLVRRLPTGLAGAAFWLGIWFCVLFLGRWIPGGFGTFLGVLQIFVGIALVSVAIPLLWRLVRKNMLWSLRNKLALTYLLIGLAPVRPASHPCGHLRLCRCRTVCHPPCRLALPRRTKPDERRKRTPRRTRRPGSSAQIRRRRPAHGGNRLRTRRQPRHAAPEASSRHAGLPQRNARRRRFQICLSYARQNSLRPAPLGHRAARRTLLRRLSSTATTSTSSPSINSAGMTAASSPS